MTGPRVEPGETVLWQGQPAGQIVPRHFWAAPSILGWLVVAFGAFWFLNLRDMLTDPQIPFPISLFPVIGLGFVAIGLWKALVSPVTSALRRRSTRYALTDRAAYIEERGTITRYPLERMLRIEFDPGPPGSVLFHHDVKQYTRVRTNRGGKLGSSTSRRSTGFVLIPDADTIHQRLLGAKAKLEGRQ
jgi:hypothetical protein